MPGALVPADPAAVRSILATPGSPTLFTYGRGEGPGAALAAARAANECPLAHAPGATTKAASLFVAVTGGPTLSATEAFEAVAAVRMRFGGETTTLLCARVVADFGDRVEVAVLGASTPVLKPLKKGKGTKPGEENQLTLVLICKPTPRNR